MEYCKIRCLIIENTSYGEYSRLLNVIKLPKEQSYSIIKDWLDKCNKIEKLNFNAKIKIKEGIKGASKGYFPISLEKLKDENKQLYDSIVNSSIENS